MQEKEWMKEVEKWWNDKTIISEIFVKKQKRILRR